MTRIRKAVVAVAGSGTRFLPVTKAMPKEMLPIVDKPIIQLVAEEIVEAGIQDVIFVTKWDKRPLEDHFDPNWALTHELQKAGKDHLLDDIDHLANKLTLVEDYSVHGLPMIGVQEVPREEIPQYGIVKLREGTCEIEDIVEKPSINEAPSRLADFGRMILNKEIVNVLKTIGCGSFRTK